MVMETNQETAVIKVNPGQDLAVTVLQDEANKLQVYAQNLTITTNDDVKLATNDLSLLSKLKKAIEEKRKEYVTPINDHIKAVNETFKTILVPVEEADKITRQKVMAYQREQDCIRLAQEEVNRLRIEAAKKEMELKGELTESVNLVEVVEVQKKVNADMGSLGTMKIWKFEVIDKALVPEDYKQIDMVKVGAVVRASKGGVSIPGIRIFSEETLKVSAR